MTSKFLMLGLIFLGILFITISLVQNSNKCPEAKIVYRYLPRSFEEEQSEPVYVSDIFKTMFTQQSPWIRSMQDIDTKKQESMNKFFISQY
jgi:hypothetical protein